MSNNLYLTRTGVQGFLKQLKQTNHRRRRLSEILKLARGLNSNENGDIEIAQSEQDFLEAKVGEIKYLLNNSKTLTRPASKKIALGSRVKLKTADRKSLKFTIVKTFESNPRQDRISDESPLGQELIGRAAGEEILLKSPKGSIKYKIEKIY